MIGGSERWIGRLCDIAVAALVIHGRSDPIPSFEHGRKPAARLGARLVGLDSVHELNPGDWGRIVAEIRLVTA
jgi:pimeloyl-ACP methyl ester carboxylesterase